MVKNCYAQRHNGVENHDFMMLHVKSDLKKKMFDAKE